jgi:sec-independent protein translocase protein TatC
MTDEFEEEQFEEKPFLEHLEDLRMTLLKIIVATIAGALVCLAVSRQIFSLLKAPIERYAEIVSEEKSRAGTGEEPDKKRPAQEVKEEQPPPRLETGPRVIVVGPVGGFVMLARDLLVYSREAITFLNRSADKLRAPQTGPPPKKGVESPKSTSPAKKKGPRPKKKEAPPVRIIETGPTKGFIVVIKTSFICGLGATLPLNLFFLAQFVFPALTRKEKRYVTPSFLIGGVLFAVGLLFGYFLTLPLALKIFVEINRRYEIENVWRISEYLGTVTKLLIANGVVFEMPLLLVVLVRLGVLSVGTLRKKRRHAVVIILFVAALLTPTDAATMFMLAVPMFIMYEASIWVSWILMRRKRRREEEEERRESYWEERRRIRRSDKVEPEEKKDTPSDERREREDHGPAADDYTEDYWHEEQGGYEEPPEEGGEGEDYSPPEEEDSEPGDD